MSGVGDRQQHAAAVVGVPHVDAQRAALRHGVPRVDGEVDDHLLDLAGVRAHAAALRIRRRDDLDVLPEQPPQHRLDAADRLDEVDHLRLQNLPPAEGEQLARELGGAVGRQLDLLDVLPLLVTGLQGIQHEMRVAADRLEDVVEVVRDPTRERPDCLELLRLTELFLRAAQAHGVRHHVRNQPQELVLVFVEDLLVAPDRKLDVLVDRLGERGRRRSSAPRFA